MILAIGAFDSSGGAGLDQDRRTAEKLGCPVRAAVTGITVQGKKGVTAIQQVPAVILQKQLKTHLEEDSPQAIKIGALCDISQISLLYEVLLSWKKENPRVPVIADPVFRPTKGIPFLGNKGIDSYPRLFPIMDVITPNRMELATLTGCSVTSLEDAEKAAFVLSRRHNISVIITGGHFSGEVIEEVVVSPDGTWTFSKERRAFPESHGTGCCLSSALTVYMAKGLPVSEAFPLATGIVTSLFSEKV